jgi:hypothetical protein
MGWLMRTQVRSNWITAQVYPKTDSELTSTLLSVDHCRRCCQVQHHDTVLQPSCSRTSNINTYASHGAVSVLSGCRQRSSQQL